MNKKQILYLILTVIFILLNVSVLFLAVSGAPPLFTILTLTLSFVLGVFLYFILRFHKREVERRRLLEEMSEKDETGK